MLAHINQFCDNRDNLVTTFFCEVVTLKLRAISSVKRFVTTVTTSTRDTCAHMRTHTCARDYVVTYVTSCFLIKKSDSYVVTTAFYSVVFGCLGCHKAFTSWGWV